MSRSSTFVAGLLTGLLSTGLLLLLISEPHGEPVTLLPPPTPGPLQIHVAGAVVSPGVHALPRGSIVQEAIEAAGGPAPDARLDALNLAEQLSDGQRVFVPLMAEANQPGDPEDAPADPPLSGKVNINTASMSDLERLPGIGPALAARIVEYREANGPFASIEDLTNVSGIGPSKLETIHELITLE